MADTVHPPAPSAGDPLVEAAEALDLRILRDYVHTQRRRWPEGGAALRSNAAGVAALDGAGRESRLAGVTGPDAEVELLVGWFARARRSAPQAASAHARCRLVLAPGAPQTLLRALAARGFAYERHALVMWRALADLPAADEAVRVSEAAAGHRAQVVELSARGYLDGALPGPLDLRAAHTWLDLPRATGFVAHRGSEPAGVGVVAVRGAHALLGQVSVLPAHRGHGVHRALLIHRLHRARAAGATVAFATCAPSGPSLGNLRRLGFAISHARISLSD